MHKLNMYQAMNFMRGSIMNTVSLSTNYSPFYGIKFRCNEDRVFKFENNEFIEEFTEIEFNREFRELTFTADLHERK